MLLHTSATCIQQYSLMQLPGGKRSVSFQAHFCKPQTPSHVSLLSPQMKGSTVLLSTGTDEHGLKVFEAAERAGVAPSDYCTDVSSSFQCLFDRSGVAYHDYIRTTDQRHIDVVQEVWNRLNAGGFIYKGEYASQLQSPARGTVDALWCASL